MTNENELLDFFKIMANADRLKIAGLLGIEPLSAVGLADRLKIKPMAVANHLERLSALGLVKQNGALYALDVAALDAMSRRVLAGSRPRVSPEDFDGEAYERKVLSDFISPDGRLKSIPSQDKKMKVVLEHVAKAFEPGAHYTEKEVNGILMGYYQDIAFLRRYLVDNGYLGRSQDGRDYWRKES
jgi:DNA-binding transcriptional ArsR family regulator